LEETTPIQWALRPLKHYADFRGRAPRAEYWWWTLAVTITSVVLAYLDQMLTGPIYGDLGPLGLIQILALLVPGAAVTVRRLHDVDRSGWWFILNLWTYSTLLTGSLKGSFRAIVDLMPVALTLIGVLAFLAIIVIMFVFMVTRRTEGANRYGPDPYGPAELEEVFA